MKSFISNTLIEAGKLLISQFGKEKIIEYKSENGKKDYNQIVTKQDLLIEKFIIHEIYKKYPSTNIISEEKLKNDFSLESATWVIDPIDGTMNFYRGINFYNISMSFWENNEPLFAGVYCPYNNDLFCASKGKGATLNEKRINVSKIENIDDSIILLSGFESFRKHQKEKYFFNLISSIKNMRILSSSVLDICYIAAGRCDGRIFSDCKFWDLSAAKLILEEAGGLFSDWDGKTNNLFSNTAIASNTKIHSKLINLLHV